MTTVEKAVAEDLVSRSSTSCDNLPAGATLVGGLGCRRRELREQRNKFVPTAPHSP
jgi:hypothetical protein